MPSLNPRVDLLIESPTRAFDKIFEKLRSEGRDVIRFSAGEPGIPPPREVREWLAKFLLEDSARLYSYTPSSGLRELKEAIAEDLRDLGGVEVSIDQITATTGGQSAMFSVLSATLSERDEVILIDPTFFGYTNLLSYMRIKKIFVPVSIESNYMPDPNQINERINRGKTKAIILVNPDNPTGRVINWNIARDIAEIAIDNDLWIIYDEPYRTLVYEGEHVYMYKLAPENTIALNTFSKDPGIPGWRLGYIYGPREVVKKINMIVEAITYNPPSVAQYLAIQYLRDRELRKRHIEYVKRVSAEKRDLMIRELGNIRDIRFVKPSGGMFLLVDLGKVLDETNISAKVFSEKLLEEKAVAVIPGEFFGETVKRSIRLNFTFESPERIVVGINRIREFIEELKGR